MGTFRIPRLELVFSTLRDGLNSGHDLAIAAVHSLLLGKDFLLARLGDDLTAADAAEASSTTELLPVGWNSSQDVYALQYVRTTPSGGDKYLLKAIKIDNGLHLSLIRLRDEKVANVSLDVSNYITGDLSAFDKAYKNPAELSSAITKDLLQPFDTATDATKPAAARSQGSQQPEAGLQKSPAAAPKPSPKSPPPAALPPNPSWLPARPDPYAYGQSDLDPLGGGLAGRGGGMFLDPMRQWRAEGRGSLGPFGQPPGSEFVPGGLPRGAVPPGARFDPFGPQLPHGFNDPRPRPGLRGPDPDHMPPPGYDDMFM